ncbi:TetR/AcrR family transcriptional regulator [Hymenobacter sp. BT186]|uniref:TetR/AcrR family transcriptional regulator n=1 Tax=Hymenobacter telluris TaxID=2816474 RepID=A0A939EV90_9BACT|nr:TetR/AcrR family transcriptional regulator [Hymenobacter telluris]MBO0358140.1 TetR/AcrR family transcriptional regulator [Hymenobacter telluris]MBW3374167.1 TetR/AcrR family transcriptional regulator [Hymenobacter norwichensis]
MALVIIREEGADRLTLGHLATRAGVSKPIAYEHFTTRSGLLTALYKLLDEQHVQALQEALTSTHRTMQDTADVLATAYVRCSLDMGGEWHAVRAALAGNEEMGVVQQELLAGYVQLFHATLAPHSSLPPAALYRCCVGLVGAGEALSVLMLSGQCSELEAASTFSSLIQGSLSSPPHR